MYVYCLPPSDRVCHLCCYQVCRTSTQNCWYLHCLNSQSYWVALTITINYTYNYTRFNCLIQLYISLTHFWSKRCWIWFCYHYLRLVLVCWSRSGNFYFFLILFCLLTETIFSSWFLNESKYKLNWVSSLLHINIQSFDNYLIASWCRAWLSPERAELVPYHQSRTANVTAAGD